MTKPGSLPTAVLLAALLHLGEMEALAAWRTEPVHVSAYSALSSMRVDRAGVPGFAYGEDGLFFARRQSPGVWKRDTVVDRCLGFGVVTSLDFDAANEPAIAFQEPASKTLVLARHGAGGWTLETVDPGADVGARCVLRFDRAGQPAILYYDGANMALKLARASGASWSIEVVVPGPTNAPSSLAFDAAGNPAVSYHDPATRDVRLARWNGTGWDRQSVTPVTASVILTSLAFDPSNNPGIAIGMGNGMVHVRYAHFDGSAWSTETIDPNVGSGAVSLLFDDAGSPLVAYISGSSNKAVLATKTGSAWQLHIAESALYWSMALALDTAGNPIVGYAKGKGASGEPRFATWTGAGFAIESVDPSIAQLDAPALAFDPSDRPWVAYREVWFDVRVAHWDGAQWLNEYPFTRGYDRWPSIRFDPAGLPAVATFKPFTQDPVLARFDGTVWTEELIEVPSLMGFIVSLAFDRGGAPHVAYADYSSNDLRHAVKTGGTWRPELVEATGDSGHAPSLAIDAGDQPAISFVNTTFNEVRLARFTGTVWSIETIASANPESTSLVFDRTGKPWVSFQDDARKDLLVAHRETGGWVVETVAATGDVGRWSSLAVDAAGLPAVSFSDATQGAVRFARWDGSAWQIETVAEGDTGYQTALAFDSAGVPGIAYQGECAKDIWLARPLAIRVHRGRVATLDPGWQAAALPLTSLDDDETAPFPAGADGVRQLDDAAPPAVPLLLYRMLGDGDVDVAKTLSAVKRPGGALQLSW